MNAAAKVPEGYWEDAQGCFVPDSKVKEVDKLRDQMVRKLFEKARELNALMREFKAAGFGDVESFIQLSCEQYNVTVGGKKGNTSLMTYDGRLKIQRSIQESITFDERLQAAKALIDECIEEWTQGSRDEIKALINRAFQTNTQGEIKTGSVLSLKNLDIQHPKWTQAMTAIHDSIRVTGSKPYLRFYERNDDGVYVPLSLDLATI